MDKKIGLLGSGGQADEAASFYSGEVAFRAVSKMYINDIANVDLADPSEDERITTVCIAVGAPGLRRDFAGIWPGDQYASIIASGAMIDRSAEIGLGSIIAPYAVITTRVRIGRHALINVAASVQHNSILGDYVTVGPGARIAGGVVVGDGVYVGIGATISNGVTIAEGAVVGAGATLLADAKEKNGVYIGTPARLLRVNGDWLHEI